MYAGSGDALTSAVKNVNSSLSTKVPASKGKKIAAFTLEFIVSLLPTLFLYLISTPNGKHLVYIIPCLCTGVFLIEILTFMTGGYGNLVFDLQVVTKDGKDIGTVRFIWRALVKCCTFLGGWVTALFSDENRALHDFLSGAYVLG